MLSIGPYSHSSRVIVAPMAGVTDQPFRNLCRQFGANWLVSEMVTSDIKLWRSRKSQQRLRFHDEREPRWIQIAGADPGMMAEAAAEKQKVADADKERKRMAKLQQDAARVLSKVAPLLHATNAAKVTARWSDVPKEARLGVGKRIGKLEKYHAAADERVRGTCVLGGEGGF